MLDPDLIRATLPQLPCFLCLYSTLGTLLWANKIGYGLDHSALGRPSLSFIVDDDQVLWQEAFRRCLLVREVVPFTVRCQVPAPPGWVTLTGSLAPIVLDGQVILLASFALDTTFRPPQSEPARFFLSPIEQKILTALLDQPKPLKSHAIAHRAGLSAAGSRLRTLLTNLVERNLLVSYPSGYRLNPEALTLLRDLLDNSPPLKAR